MIKVLIVGYGSIAKKHIDAFHHLDAMVGVLRRQLQPQDKNEKVLFWSDHLRHSIEWNPDIAIVCTPSSTHVETALDFLKSGVKVLIEKPLAPTVAETDSLRIYDDQIKVGYTARFSEIYQQIHYFVTKYKVRHIEVRRSHNLESWLGTDRFSNYISNASLGGGVALTLSHELDLIMSNFGRPTRFGGTKGKFSTLTNDTDDVAFYWLVTENNIFVSFYYDLLGISNRNEIRLLADGDEIILTLDRAAKVTPNGETHIILETVNPISNMYISEAQEILKFARGHDNKLTSLEQSIYIIELLNTLG